jgi:hypothetical protein
MQKPKPHPKGSSTPRILITDASVAHLAFAKTEAGYIARDREVRGFIVKVGMRRKTYRYESEHRNDAHLGWAQSFAHNRATRNQAASGAHSKRQVLDPTESSSPILAARRNACGG